MVVFAVCVGRECGGGEGTPVNLVDKIVLRITLKLIYIDVARHQNCPVLSTFATGPESGSSLIFCAILDAYL